MSLLVLEYSVAHKTLICDLSTVRETLRSGVHLEKLLVATWRGGSTYTLTC